MPLADVIKFGLPNVGISNFFVPNIYSAPGIFSLEVILYGQCLSVVSGWQIDLAGSINNSSSFFTATSVLTQSTNISLPQVSGDETEFAVGKEIYPIRSARSTPSTFSSVTALTMLPPDGTAQQPDAPSSLANDGTVATVSGPVLSAMGTEIVGGIEQGAANFDLIIRLRSTGRSTGGPGKDYIVDFQLQTSPIGHDIDPSGTSTPVEVGTVTINLPNFRDGGTNSFVMPLYADTLPGNVDQIWLDVHDDGGGGISYIGGLINGTADIVFTPIACFPYEDSNLVPVWDNDGNLLLTLAELEDGEP